MAPRKKSKIERVEEVEAELAPRDSRTGWYVALGVGIVVFALTTLLAHKHSLSGINLAIFRHIDNWPNKLRPVFLALTIAPSALWIGVAAVAVTSLLRLWQLTWQLAAAILSGFVAAELFKHVIAEPRPQFLVPDVHARVVETDPSFPSGHAMTITVVVLTLWPYLPRGWRWVVLLAIPLMCLSRLYLGVHSPVDVVGGVALGLVVVSAMRSLPDVWRRFLRLD